MDDRFCVKVVANTPVGLVYMYRHIANCTVPCAALGERGALTEAESTVLVCAAGWSRKLRRYYHDTGIPDTLDYSELQTEYMANNKIRVYILLCNPGDCWLLKSR